MPGDAGKVQFPLPPKYWEHPGDAPPFRLWNVQFENCVFRGFAKGPPADKMTDEFKNRLLFSLLGDEAISTFACLPKALSMDTMTFANFHKAAKAHFQPITSLIHAYFDFQSRRQQEDE